MVGMNQLPPMVKVKEVIRIGPPETMVVVFNLIYPEPAVWVTS
jgi:hypothetical protein